jgi:acyl-CoA reductase-like NAD-dependent aldehyde dehydrogenase
VSDHDLDDALAAVRRGAAQWVTLPIAEKRAVLRQVRAATLAVASEWVDTACAIAEIDPRSPAAGEQWSTGPYALIAMTSALEKTLKLLEKGRSPLDAVEVSRAPGGRVALRAFPYLPKDAVLPGYEADVWLRPGIELDAARDGIARALRDPERPPRVTAVLGAGNVTGIPALDLLNFLYAEASAVVVKLHPVTERMSDALEAAFAPLIARDVLRVIIGGADVGHDLIRHQAVDAVHLTGSRSTHDAILFGTDHRSADRRGAAEPLLTTPLTSELGGVGPAIIVPDDEWSDDDIDAVARDLATQRLHNSGFNCVATQVIVLPSTWARADEFVDAVRAHMRAAPERRAYYPGASARQLAVVTNHPDANVLGGDPEAPRTLIDRLDAANSAEHLFTTEAFGPVIGVVRLPVESTDPAKALETAVGFCNDTLSGNLGAGVVIHPRTIEQLGDRFEEAVAALRYGTIGINSWSGPLFGMPAATWGAFPHRTPTDIGSGNGIVHNALLLDPDHVERTVGRGPWRPSPTPLWFVDNRTAHITARRLTRFAGIDSWAIAAPLGAAALDSYRRG